MPRFRHRPIIVEATQFFDVPHPGVCAKGGGDCQPYRLHLHTRHGPVPILRGDWIVVLNGETYPVAPDVFEATYEEDKDV